MQSFIAGACWFGTLVATFIGCGRSLGHAQQDLYRTAFDYLKKSDRVYQYCRHDLHLSRDSCRLTPADSVVFPSLIFFQNDLAEIKKVPAGALIDSLMLEQNERYKTFKPGSIHGMLQGAVDPTVLVVFSSPNGRYLTAEVVPYVLGESIHEAGRGRTSVLFLFIFDERGQIQNVFNKSLINE